MEINTLLKSFKNRSPVYLQGVMKDVATTFTLKKLEQILHSSDALERTLLAKVSNENLKPPSRLTPEIVLEALEKGVSIKVEDIHLFDSCLESLRQEFYEILGHACVINCYLTPPSAQCFNPHFDNHDVFIIQIQGKKLWTIDNKPLHIYPLESQSFAKNKFEFVDSQCLTLSQGDGLFIPIGHVHQAQTINTFSLHLTLGVHQMRAVDYSHQILDNFAGVDNQSMLNHPISQINQDMCFHLGQQIQKITQNPPTVSQVSEVEKEWNRKKMLQWRRCVFDEQIESLMLVMNYEAQTCSQLHIRGAKYLDIQETDAGILLKSSGNQAVVSRDQWLKFSKIFNASIWHQYIEIVDRCDFMHTNYTLQSLIVKGFVECRITKALA